MPYFQISVTIKCLRLILLNIYKVLIQLLCKVINIYVTPVTAVIIYIWICTYAVSFGVDGVDISCHYNIVC